MEKHIAEVIEHLDIDALLQSPILIAYKEFYRGFGISDDFTPAEHLLLLIQKSARLPNINRVVDCYNIASAETLLSMGAHDLSKITGNIQMRYTDGTEKYTPLGKSELEKVAPCEYGAIDEEKILCRMDLKQCDETKVGPETTEFLVYVQGNKETDEEYVLNGLQKVCDNIQKFCNGEYSIIT